MLLNGNFRDEGRSISFSFVFGGADRMKSPSILVTGGARFIGTHIVRSILAMEEFIEYGLIILDDRSGGFQENVPEHPRVEFIEGSITDQDLVNQLFEAKRFDYVYHPAASSRSTARSSGFWWPQPK